MPEHIRQEPKVLVSTENLTEQEWLAYRRRRIGGSDVAAILGNSPFRTARDLYDDKLNIASAVDDTGNWVALEMGHLLEPLVAQIFTKKTELEVFQIKKMIQHPQNPLMLADEPTGNLDSKTSDEVMSLLKTMIKKYNQTLVMITHDETIAQMADCVINIEDGKVVKDGVTND